MADNLPDGVTPNMIPGNRPQDIAIEKIHEAFDGGVSKLKLDELHKQLSIAINDQATIEERRDALYEIVNFFHDIEDNNILNGVMEWVDGIEDLAGEGDEPEEPEWEPEYDEYEFDEPYHDEDY